MIAVLALISFLAFCVEDAHGQTQKQNDTQLELMTEEELCLEASLPCVSAASFRLGARLSPAIERRHLEELNYFNAVRRHARKKRGREPWWATPMSEAIRSGEPSHCSVISLRCVDLHVSEPPQILEVK